MRHVGLFLLLLAVTVYAQSPQNQDSDAMNVFENAKVLNAPGAYSETLSVNPYGQKRVTFTLPYKYSMSNVSNALYISVQYITFPIELTDQKLEVKVYYQASESQIMAISCDSLADSESSGYCKASSRGSIGVLLDNTRVSSDIWILLSGGGTNIGDTYNSQIWITLAELEPISTMLIPVAEPEGTNGMIASSLSHHDSGYTLELTMPNFFLYNTDVAANCSFSVLYRKYEEIFNPLGTYSFDVSPFMTTEESCNENGHKATSGAIEGMSTTVDMRAQLLSNTLYLYNIICDATAAGDASSTTTQVAVAVPLVIPAIVTFYFRDTIVTTILIVVTILAVLAFLLFITIGCCCSCCCMRKEPFIEPIPPPGLMPAHIDLYVTMQPKNIKEFNLEDLNDRGLSMGEKELKAVSTLQDLSHLNLNNCGVTEIPEAFAVALFLLEILELRRNNLSEFPVNICHMAALRTLDLSHNKISDIPPDILEMKTLEFINLSHNHLKHFPDISRLHSLRYLNLSHNFISRIHQSIAERRNLLVQLRFNPLISLPPLLITPSDIRLSYSGWLFPRTLVLPFWMLGLPLWHLPWVGMLDLTTLGLIAATAATVYAGAQGQLAANVDVNDLALIPMLLLLLVIVGGIVFAGWKAFKDLKFHVDDSHSAILYMKKRYDESGWRSWRRIDSALTVMGAAIINSMQLAVIALAPGSPLQQENAFLAWLYGLLWFQIGMDYMYVSVYLLLASWIFVVIFRLLFELNSLFGVSLETVHRNDCETCLCGKMVHIPDYLNETFRTVFNILEVISELLFMPIIFRFTSSIICVASLDGVSVAQVSPDITCGSNMHLLIITISLFCLAIYAIPAIFCVPVWQEKDKLQIIRFKPLYLIYDACLQALLVFLLSVFIGNSVLGFALSFFFCTLLMVLLTLFYRPTGMIESDIIMVVLLTIPFWASVLTLASVFVSISFEEALYFFIIGFLLIIGAGVILLCLGFVLVLTGFHIRGLLREREARRVAAEEQEVRSFRSDRAVSARKRIRQDLGMDPNRGFLVEGGLRQYRVDGIDVAFVRRNSLHSVTASDLRELTPIE
jgi:hypothetical protein